jgi:hypothetical protein
MIHKKRHKNFCKNFWRGAKIGGVQGEENFCPRAVSQVAKQFCVIQRPDFRQKRFGFRPANTTKKKEF